MRARTLIAAIWLCLLAAFIAAGTIWVGFHGDEEMQIAFSTDFWILAEDANLSVLTSGNGAYERLINGNLNRYAIGLSLWLTGHNREEILTRSQWDWTATKNKNWLMGKVPSADTVLAARASSTLFTAWSVVILFGLTTHIIGFRIAFLVSALYTFNPWVLENGRRAMMEGSMLCFGLLVVWLAAIIALQRTRGQPVRLITWVGFIVAGALALASKHTAVVFVGAALAWVALAEVWRTGATWRTLFAWALRPILAGIFVFGLFIALSPALWRDIPSRLVDLVNLRSELLARQAANLQEFTLSPIERLNWTITVPFSKRYIRRDLASLPPNDQYRAYVDSGLSGAVYNNTLIGSLLTLLAGISGVVEGIRLVRGSDPLRKVRFVGIGVLFVFVCATLVINQLPWERYFMPLIPVACLMVGFGVAQLTTLVMPIIARLHAFQPTNAPNSTALA